jgi:hypothetical protein
MFFCGAAICKLISSNIVVHLNYMLGRNNIEESPAESELLYSHETPSDHLGDPIIGAD